MDDPSGIDFSFEYVKQFKGNIGLYKNLQVRCQFGHIPSYRDTLLTFDLSSVSGSRITTNNRDKLMPISPVTMGHTYPVDSMKYPEANWLMFTKMKFMA